MAAARRRSSGPRGTGCPETIPASAAASDTSTAEGISADNAETMFGPVARTSAITPCETERNCGDGEASASRASVAASMGPRSPMARVRRERNRANLSSFELRERNSASRRPSVAAGRPAARSVRLFHRSRSSGASPCGSSTCAMRASASLVRPRSNSRADSTMATSSAAYAMRNAGSSAGVRASTNCVTRTHRSTSSGRTPRIRGESFAATTSVEAAARAVAKWSAVRVRSAMSARADTTSHGSHHAPGRRAANTLVRPCSDTALTVGSSSHVRNVAAILDRRAGSPVHANASSSVPAVSAETPGRSNGAVRRNIMSMSDMIRVSRSSRSGPAEVAASVA